MAILDGGAFRIVFPIMSMEPPDRRNAPDAGKAERRAAKRRAMGRELRLLKLPPPLDRG
jgi:hypothetical protein